MSAVELRLPVAFYEDHVSRDLPSGVVIRSTKRSVFVALTPDEIAELRSDAVHYSDAARWIGPEAIGLQSSARATVRAIDSVVAR